MVLGKKRISVLVLSAKFVGSSLFPVRKWPCPVYIARITDETIVASHSFTRGQVEVIAWGAIFPTLDAARAHTKNFLPCNS